MKENKKIGKLLELLNEFYKEKGDIFRAIQHNDRLKVFELENDDLVRDVAIISKEYGFIKWLVENDKIDIESYCRITSIERKGEKDVYRDEVDSLLMLLAIKDEPIRFLCEIIK